jgi:hypothetical protein
VRPESIRQFDYFYLGATAFGLLSFLAGYGRESSILTYAFGFQAELLVDLVVLGAIRWSLLVGLLVTLVAPLALWYLTALRANQTTRWIVAAWGVLDALRLLFLLYLLGWLVVARFPVESWVWYAMLFGVVAEMLRLGAVFFLFPEDAGEWFLSRGLNVRHEDVFS